MRLVFIVARFLAAQISDIAWIAGLASVAYGISMINLPAGIIAAGLALCFTGYALGAESDRE